ncbi:MAG TPA: NAD-dependent epimerase/dehydratase family protein [Candidatus Binatia bacterium]|nr:NAD-dependent epimerase/dehydratase family protein [Candidatus Binatia bacterium]
MRILFLGGTGNISAECAALLHERGHDIIVLSRGRETVPTEYQAVQADRRDIAAMRAALKGIQPEVVVNFIGYEVAELAVDFELFNGQVRQYVFISSVTIYAKPPRQLPLTEEAPVGNVYWDYAQKKLACEQWLQQRRAEVGFPVTIIRPSHTYSKRWIPNPVASSNYTYAARLEQGKPVFVPDEGKNPWTLTAASDFAVGLGGLVGNDKATGEVFQITSDEVLTWNEIVREIAEALGVKSAHILRIPTDFICEQAPQLTGNIKGDKAHPGIFDNSKIKRLVPEFSCRKPFRLGIRESIAWLRGKPERMRVDAGIEAMMEQVVGAWQRRDA